MATKKQDKAVQEAFDEVLRAIIDEWFERVSGYYVTETLPGDPEAGIELKRFHDEKGHRIKFNKDSLDLTYGLHATWTKGSFHLDISVNNKVEEFDYADFKRSLFDHYRAAGQRTITASSPLSELSFQELFRLESGISEAFTVEKRGEQAEIMRLSFVLNPEYLEVLAQQPDLTKKLIEGYCVSPFRNIYARVYRSRA